VTGAQPSTLRDHRSVVAERLGPQSAVEVASMASAFIAGVWPLANPDPTVIAATEDPDLLAAHVERGHPVNLTSAAVAVTVPRGRS
jgi:hypothetical protein